MVVSTQLKNISQIGSFPQVEVKKKYFKPPPRLVFVDSVTIGDMFQTKLAEISSPRPKKNHHQ